MHAIDMERDASREKADNDIIERNVGTREFLDCAEDKERYEKELAALPAEKKAKLSRKSSKKAKKTRGAAAVRIPCSFPNAHVHE